jgi:hypothetical protein
LSIAVRSRDLVTADMPVVQPSTAITRHSVMDKPKRCRILAAIGLAAHSTARESR